MRFYSPSTSGFYDSNIHDSMPSDVIDISDSHYMAMIKGQSEGRSIQCKDGNVYLEHRLHK